MAFLEVFGGALALVAGRKFYDDALRPPAKELGKAGAAAVRAIRAAGIGPEQAVELRDDLVAFIGRAVRRVPEANRVEPPPQILGPVLEQLRYEPIDTPIAEMLEAILARSMDKDRVFEAHPAFVQIVRGLAPDEVRLLRRLAQGPLYTAWAPPLTKPEMAIGNGLPSGLIEWPDAFRLYYIHLSAIDLCIYTVEARKLESYAGAMTYMPEHTEYRHKLGLTAYGETLMRAADLSSSPPSASDDTEHGSSA